ncbi:methionyl-tRNA formyltransferase [Derxia gummosa]|uniref:Methionyl-tRNA formyltransferase n=1 Tax=Derxia gummosa DSM 723 TaxID=1121388 RepID=A0A8B6X0K1_9BURK|nr:methionyl-tRNA formyltransferase [Derxia gummosa]
MRIVFAGTPEFAACALDALIAAGHEITLVLTQPDRPAGRGMKLQPSPVKALALKHGIEVFQPQTLRLTHPKHGAEGAEAQRRLAAEFGKPVPPAAAGAALTEAAGSEVASAATSTTTAAPADVMIVAAYGLILPQEVLDLPARGCINIHASLLPRWRGAAPIHRAIEAGDAETGIAIMQMDVGLDTGAVLLERRLSIGADESTGQLHDRLAALGGEAIVEALARLDTLAAVPQPADGVSYAAKIAKSEAAIDFAEPAEVIARRIRAFDPFPGASAECDGVAIKFWQATVVPAGDVDPTIAAPAEATAAATAGGAAPGSILAADADGVLVACGSGALRVTALQKPGGKRLPARDFLAGHPLRAGMRFTSAARESA